MMRNYFALTGAKRRLSRKCAKCFPRVMKNRKDKDLFPWLPSYKHCKSTFESSRHTQAVAKEVHELMQKNDLWVARAVILMNTAQLSTMTRPCHSTDRLRTKLPRRALKE